MAILYVGIPLAVVGGGVSAFLFNKYPDWGEDSHKDASEMRAWAAVLAGTSFVIGCISLAGNVFTAQGPFGKPKSEAAQASALSSEANNDALALCEKATFAPTDDPEGIGAFMNGKYEDSSVERRKDGSLVVKLVRSRANSNRCPSRLEAACTVRDGTVTEESDLRETGFFGC